MIRQSNTPAEQAVPEPTGIVSVNARGATSSGLAGKISLALIILGVVIIGTLVAINRYRAAQSAEDRARIQAEKDGKVAANSRHRKIFAAAAAPLPLAAMGNKEACPNGSAAQLVLGTDGRIVMDATGRPKQHCVEVASVAPVGIGTAADDPSFNQIVPPPPITITAASQGAVPAPRSRYNGDIIIPSPPGASGLIPANVRPATTGDDAGPLGLAPIRVTPAAQHGSADTAGATQNPGRRLPDPNGSMGDLLAGTRPAAVSAAMIGNRDMILPQGRSIDCNLSVRLINEVSGMATCMLSANVYSDNGRVVLAERGSTAVGEYVALMAQGQRRLFVLWTRLQTPKGVIIDVQSPGTDALGTSGLPGHIDNRWGERIGAAVLLSLVEDAIDYKTAQANDDGANHVRGIAVLQNSTQTGRSLAERILDSTINIKPTLYKNQGDRASIFVSRDLDFGSVYVLRAK